MKFDAPTNMPDARVCVEALLSRAMAAGASDIHVEPTGKGAEVRLRVDGLLGKVEEVSGELGRGIVLRLMVMAQLLTYRLDIPQEGRIAWQEEGGAGTGRRVDFRLAIMPTAHGLRAVVRLPADMMQPKSLEELELPAGVVESLKRFARSDGGMMLVTGPAGSGKTTTIYALLEYIAGSSQGLSIISLEDPVERLLAGVTQIEVTPHGQMTYERALKSILRQDPQVLMLGEIRDAATASIGVQAALSGHRLIATLHAGEPAGALARLLEMGIEPYQITSSMFGILSQRLVRRKEGGGGYRGRVPLAEFAGLDKEVREAVLKRADADSLRKIFAGQAGHVTIRTVADDLVAQGITDAAEVQRVLGD